MRRRRVSQPESLLLAGPSRTGRGRLDVDNALG
jgi:hypothetical protein